MTTKDKQTKDDTRKPADKDRRRDGQSPDKRNERDGFEQDEGGTSLGDVER